MKKWQENRNPSTKTKLNKAPKELRATSASKHEEEAQHFIQSLSASKDSNYSLWKATKHSNQPAQRMLPINSHNETWGKKNCSLRIISGR